MYSWKLHGAKFQKNNYFWIALIWTFLTINFICGGCHISTFSMILNITNILPSIILWLRHGCSHRKALDFWVPQIAANSFLIYKKVFMSILSLNYSYQFNLFIDELTLSCMLSNGQTYFKNLAMFTLQDF